MSRLRLYVESRLWKLRRRLAKLLRRRTRIEAPHHVREVVSPLFDAEYYLSVYKDVRDAGVEPFEHFLSTGAFEGRDPNPDFSTSYYLQSNPDVRAAGINPFYHYIVAGRNEGRQPKLPGGFRARHLMNQRPLDELIRGYSGRPAFPEPGTLRGVSDLQRVFEERLNRGQRRIIVALSHDDYTRVTGGIQACMRVEQAAFARDGAVYINLHPWRALPVLAPELDVEPVLDILCDGRPCGTARAGDVLTALESIAARADVSFILAVHALLGHSPEFVVHLARALRPETAFFWIHDYFSLCPSYTLMRNGITFCGAPPPESGSCSICVFGEERRIQLPRMRSLFEEVPFTVVAPSHYALELWQRQSDLPYTDAIVEPHCTIQAKQTTASPATTGSKRLSDDAPVRVAFLGYPLLHKGWPVFEQLASQLVGDPRYQLYHVGQTSEPRPHLAYRRVPSRDGADETMADVIAEEQIDIALIWPLWPETFSFVTHEALAGGAVIVTNDGSGNVARVVREQGAGLVLADEAELIASFERGDPIAMARENRCKRRHGSISFGRLTASLCRTSTLAIR
jgi:hypothetical protein